MARSTSRRKKKSNVISVNFKGVEGKGVVIPEGKYRAKPVEIEANEGKQAEYLKWKFEVTAGKQEGKNLYYNTSLAPQALWNLRGMLEALGIEVPDDEMDVDIEEIIGGEGEVILVVEHETYEGRVRANVVDFYNADGEEEEDEEEDDEDDKKSKSKKSSRKARDDDDDDDEDEDSKKSSRKSKKSKKSDDDEDDDDEDDKKSKKKGKKSKGISTDELEDMSESELEDLVEEHELDVDLSKAKTLTKKRNKVQDALEEAGLLAA